MSQPKIRIFIDFWNFQLSWNEYHRKQNPTSENIVRIPWKETLPNSLVNRADPKGIYGGTHVYASVNPYEPKDKGLKNFLVDIMNGFQGYTVIVKDRRAASSLKCTNKDCRSPITECPKCQHVLKRTVEKGIDATLITDLIKAAHNNTFDQAILITEDSDFVPAVEFIQERWSKQIIHAFFRGKSHQLRNACWKHLFFDDFMSELMPAES